MNRDVVVIISYAIWHYESMICQTYTELAEAGLSSFGMIESNVLTSIEQVLKHFE